MMDWVITHGMVVLGRLPECNRRRTIRRAITGPTPRSILSAGSVGRGSGCCRHGHLGAGAKPGPGRRPSGVPPRLSQQHSHASPAWRSIAVWPGVTCPRRGALRSSRLLFTTLVQDLRQDPRAVGRPQRSRRRNCLPSPGSSVVCAGAAIEIRP